MGQSAARRERRAQKARERQAKRRALRKQAQADKWLKGASDENASE